MRKQVGIMFFHDQHKEWQIAPMNVAAPVAGWYGGEIKPVWVDAPALYRKCKYRRGVRR